MSSYRMERVEHLIREEVSNLILRKRIKDPRVSTLVSVSRIQVSRDLAHAKIWMSGFGGESSGGIAQTVKALNHAAGFIQHEVGKKLHTRSTPKMTFIEDHSIEEGFRVNKIIEDLNS
jgi:ribosome-binding factor A